MPLRSNCLQKLTCDDEPLDLGGAFIDAERANLAIELFRNLAADDAPASAVINLGVTYKLTGHWSLLASGGPGLRNTDQTGSYDAYLALEAQY